MKKTVKTILALVLFAALLFGAYWLYGALEEEYRPDVLQGETTTAADSGETTPDTTAAESEERQLALDFTVYDESGRAVKLSDFFGKPIVLNFWASWCTFCLQEMPDFNEVYRTHGEDIQFLMVNLTSDRNETMDKALSYLDEKGFAFPVYYDKDGDAAIIYQVSGIPVTFFIDKDGYLAAYANSMLDKETLLRGIGMIADGEES